MGCTPLRHKLAALTLRVALIPELRGVEGRVQADLHDLDGGVQLRLVRLCRPARGFVARRLLLDRQGRRLLRLHARLLPLLLIVRHFLEQAVRRAARR